jgi:hypothetical protein
MRSLSYLLFLAGLAVLIPMPRMLAGDFKLEPGFTLLFNGKDLTGWQPKGKKESLEGKTEAFKGRFKVEKGALVVDYVVKGDSYIETVKEFPKDVHIKLDFKPGEGCNNDLIFRGTKFDIVPKALKNAKEGEWSTVEIIATGDKIEHKVNGEKKNSTKYKVVTNHLVIRAELGAIQIKNIRVKEGS